MKEKAKGNDGMGIFDFFKKRNKNENERVEDPKVEYDLSDVFPSKEELLDAFEKGIKSGAIVEETEEHNMFRQEWDKLTPEGELPYGWREHNKGFYSEFENNMVKYATSLKAAAVDQKIRTLKDMISEYYVFKDKCYSSGECYQKYFSDMWEHCHNSRSQDFEYIQPYENELNELLKNYDSFKKKEQISEIYEGKLHDLILDIVSNHSGGILQTDVYKMFPGELKEEIQKELYFSERNGYITREKNGRTYLIKLK